MGNVIQENSETNWNVKILVLLLIPAIILQYVLHPVLMSGFSATCFAFIFALYDFIYIGRIIVAIERKESGKAWIAYVILLFSTPAWALLPVIFE